MARKLAAVAQLLGLRIEEELAIDVDAKSLITGFTRTTAEVSAAMNMTPAGARRVVAHAEALDCRLPQIAALLAAGRVDWATVELVITRTELVDDKKCARLDETLAEKVGGWRCWSRQRIIDAVDAAVKTIDADAAKERRVVAFDERGIRVTADADGTARLHGRVSASTGARLDKTLSAMATAVCRRDPRTLKQRRADAFDALLDRRALACTCDDPACPNRGEDAPAGKTVVINVIRTADTVAGKGDQPGYLTGFGVIDAEQVRELARDAIRRPVEQPQVSDSEAFRYRPSAALDRWIRCRDLTCRFPGCTVPAERCDVDHTEPFNHADPAAGGLTVPWNLACYCREHHRLKTFHSGAGGWRDEQLDEGTIVWTSPTGRVYHTTPGGTEVFPTMRVRRPEDRKRIAAARKRLRERRPVNEYHRHRNHAAAREIHDRRFRNRFRRTRVLFHGSITDKPSTSPFCRWVNDPIEPEELPPDWRPPPLTTSDSDEPPPF